MDENYKFICEKCDYKCNIISRWEKHINTELHITGKKKIRSDYKGEKKCIDCDYIGKTLNNLIEHKLNYHSSVEEREKEFKYYCKLCDYGTLSKDLINNHKNTKKHKRFESYTLNNK